MNKMARCALSGAVFVCSLLMPGVSRAQTGTVTLRMTEVPNQPVNGLTVQGVTFHFTIANAASADAAYNAANGGQLRFVQDPALEGNALGTLTIDFANPVVDLSFGAVRSTQTTLAQGVLVSLFDPALNLIG